jgi:tRNA-Thr(GGU) m(6)t(6)A37 methyltransferase TsaA
MEVIFQPIGIIHSPFTSLEEMPIQPSSETSGPGTIEVFPEFSDGLKDLEGFSHIYILYHLHRVKSSKLTVTPFLDDLPHGIFATRAPSRPNPIGLSLVELVRVEANTLHVNRVDVLDNTPLLDIKPYVPQFEEANHVRIGWLEKARSRINVQKSDDRFE